MPLPVVKQINDLLWYLHRRGERRWLDRDAERWGRVRAGGRSRYVRRYALGWGLSMALLLNGWSYLAGGRLSVMVTVLTVPLCVALGWWSAAGTRADSDRLYERARKEGRLGRAPGDG